MAGRLAILHGWSDTSASFQPLRAWLGAHGHPTTDVWLGDYISLDDDVRVEDVAKRMKAVVDALIADGTLASSFDLIVHSTGALVAREWLATFYPDGAGCPVKRLVMLAPANFGSRLAAVGKSMIGRLIKGLNNRLETGEEMLRALELASPYQWNLTRRDLLQPPEQAAAGAPAVSPFGVGKVLPFVIIGTRAYDSGVQQIVNEDGSDGTVRVPAGNLNVVGMTLDFSRPGPDGAPRIQPWPSRTGNLQIPLAVLPERDHGEITHPETNGRAGPGTGARLGQLILDALACGEADYAGLQADWAAITKATGDLGDFGDEHDPQFVAARDRVFEGQDHPGPAHFHRYLQLIVKVTDDYGNLVKDYFLEFSDPATKNNVSRDRTVITFHKDVLEDVHNNSTTSAFRCLYIDHTDLMKIFYDQNAALAVSISAAPPGRNVKYFDSAKEMALGRVELHAQNLQEREALTDTRIFRNQTHFIEVIIPRRPIDKVFRLSQPA